MGLTKKEAESFFPKLNDMLANQSYIHGYAPSQSDTAVFEIVRDLSIPANLVHVDRWYRHIASYTNTQFPGIPTTLQQLNLAPLAADVKSAASDKPGGDAGKPISKDDEDDFELFGSDEEEDAEAERIKQERLKAYEAKKSNKPVLIAKSNIVLDVKPWDDETDMGAIESAVRSIVADGLLWGASKFVPLAYGIKKLQITCVVEDDKIGTDFLEEEITKFEDLVQSVDIAAFNKI